MTLEFDASPEDLKVFLDEADEQLQLLEEDIVKLERDGEDDELVQEIFRAAHTLKGSSATLGHKRMAELTHVMENVLDKIRRHRLELSTPLVDTLFACLDALRALKDEIVTGQESAVDLASLVHRLTDAGAGSDPVRALPRRRRRRACPVWTGRWVPFWPRPESMGCTPTWSRRLWIWTAPCPPCGPFKS